MPSIRPVRSGVRPCRPRKRPDYPDSPSGQRIDCPLWDLSWPPGGGAPVTRKLTSSTLTLDAIAKGHIVDQACSRATRAAPTGRTTDVLINLGGDIRHVGAHPAAVAVTDPRCDGENARAFEHVRICNHGLATSGGYRRRVRSAGKWRSHLVDPRNGRTAEHILSASVLAPTAATGLTSWRPPSASWSPARGWRSPTRSPASGVFFSGRMVSGSRTRTGTGT